MILFGIRKHVLNFPTKVKVSIQYGNIIPEYVSFHANMFYGYFMDTANSLLVLREEAH